MNRSVFNKGVSIIVRTFPSTNVDAGLWWPMLSDLTNENFERAVLEIIRSTKEIFPGTNWIALIREKAVKDGSPLAAEALTEVRNEIWRVGYAGNPKFSHPRIYLAVEAIGWRNLCLSENFAVERAHFLKIYETISARDQEKRMVGFDPTTKEIVSLLLTKL